MILISSEQNDYSTAKVIKWLRYYGQAFQRINEDTPLTLGQLSASKEASVSIHIDGRAFDLESIQSYWYRRGIIQLGSEEVSEFEETPAMRAFLKQIAKQELQVVADYLEQLLAAKKGLGNVNYKSINKLFALEQARQCGLQTPDTLITSQKKEVLNFISRHKKVITKPIYEMPYFRSTAIAIQAFSKLVDQDAVQQLDDHFFPSLFQNYIEKKYELRIFYLDGQCYANAIFSQAKQQSQIDSRNQSFSQPNRRVPYHLPQDLLEKITAFSKKINLNCSSIDMICTPDKEYIFLETNPVGQFGMTSYLGNFRLEQKIAKYLSNA